jgi:ribosomal protein S18 acetylase RimI-like enzyme
MIRRAKILEIPDILAVAKACAAQMIHNGIFQWDEHYPSKEAFETDVDRNELYLLEIEASITGIITITTVEDEEYSSVKWLTRSGNSVYIHRLAVHPAHQRKGYGRMLMDYAETYARDNGFVSVRLDTFSRNIRNQEFYAQRGYQKLSDIYYPRQSDNPFHCYELVI